MVVPGRPVPGPLAIHEDLHHGVWPAWTVALTECPAYSMWK
ncbi:hypothetical protein ACFVGY_22710 [Streptomyces sp. NPDC127106]